MGKSTHFTGQPLLAQLLELLKYIPLSKLVGKHQANRYTKSFTAEQHLITMLYASLAKLGSLREVTTGLLANQHTFAHVGLGKPVPRSTLAEANQKRSSAFFADVFHHLAGKARHVLPDSRIPHSILSKLVIIDSTVISLFKDILAVAGRPRLDGRKKGDIKAHVALEGLGLSPVLVCHSAGAKHDAHFIDDIEPHLGWGSWVVMDMGYTDYTAYKRWSQKGIFYVSRARSNAKLTHHQEFAVSQQAHQFGILSDALVRFPTGYNQEWTQRHIVFCDPKTGKVLEFITNNMDVEPELVCQLYKRRWQIELYVKKLKANFPLTYFLGDSVNAVEIQLWCCFIAMLLLEWVQAKVKRKWALSNLAAMVRLHVFTYIDLVGFLNNPEKQLLLQTQAGTQTQLEFT